MISTRAGRAGLSLVALLLIPVIWWATRITDWVPEIFGVYSFKRFVFNLLATAVLLTVVYLLLNRNSWRHKILASLTGFITAGICLAILELPVLFFGFNYQKLFATAGSGDALHLSQGVNKPDPVLIHIHWPNSAFSGEVVGNLAALGIPDPNRYHVDVSYDENGFRNDRLYRQADVTVIGDSFVEAAIIPLEQALVKQLEKDSEVSVVNLGQIAYGLKQELEVLERFALPLSPKLVLWVLFGGNDLRDIETYEVMRADYGKPPPPVPLEERLFLRNLLVALSNVLDSALRTQPSEKALNHSGLFTRADGTQERVYFGQTNRPVEDSQWQVTVDTLSKADRLSREAGARLVVVYVPRKFRVYREHLQLEAGTFISEWDVNKLPARLGQWCTENDIGFVDTTVSLKKTVADGIHPYFIDDVHWNPLGHRLATTDILNYLEQNGIYPYESDKMPKKSPE